MKPRETFRPVLVQFLEQEWQSHIADKFTFIESIPSGDARYFVSYIRSLSESTRDGLIADMIVRGVAFFFPEGSNTLPIGPRLEAFWNTKNAEGKGPEFIGIHFKKAIFAGEHDEVLRHITVEQYDKALSSLEPARAPELRKLLKPLLENAGYKHLDHGGGAYRYEKHLPGIPILLHIDFPGRGRQIEYDLSMGYLKNRCPSSGVSYENLLGIAHMGWDQVTKTVGGSAMSLMVAIISRLEMLMVRATEHMEGDA